MAVTQYIGARYVPLIDGDWARSKTYEPLTVVMYQGNSYTSRQAVPRGIDIQDTRFWALTGNYNAQVEMYRREAQQAVRDIDIEKSRAQAVEAALDAQIETVRETYARVFNTVAEMKAAHLVAGMICHTNGFHAVGDGGAAWYVISSEGVANEMDVIACGNVFANLVIEPEMTPEQFGTKGDGITDDFDALERLFAISRNVKLGFNKTYLVSLDKFKPNQYGTAYVGLRIANGTKIDGNQSVIKCTRKLITTTGYVLLSTDNYQGPTYYEDLPFVNGIEIKNLTLDGNAGNMDNTKSLTAIALYKSEDSKIENVKTRNCFGTDGGGYAIILAFCNRVFIDRVDCDYSSRSNIYCWESKQVLVTNSKFNGSSERDCVTNSTNTPYVYQESQIVYDNCLFEHLYTTGTHAVRITGVTTCSISNCKIIGNPSIDGIAIPAGVGTKVKAYIANTTVSNCTVGINQTGTVSDSENDICVFIEKCKVTADKAINFGQGTLNVHDNQFENLVVSNNYPLQGFSLNASGNKFKNGALVNIGCTNNSKFWNNVLDLNADAGNWIIHGVDAYALIHDNIFKDASKKIYSRTHGKIYCNHAAVDNTLAWVLEGSNA